MYTLFTFGLRNKYLRQLVTGEIQGPLIGFPSIDKKWLRNHIGIVLQDPFLYNKNILENCKNIK